MTPSLDHIQIAIPEGAEQTCRTFWGDIIGLTEIEKPEALKKRGGCWFDLSGSELHLGVETPFSPAKKAHPGFRVTEIKTLAERLTTNGHMVIWDDAIKDRQRFFTADPFGNRLEFLE
ncbi:MAG: glyoxalase [Rhodobacteraceae bacterium]|nr:glyoxalase [Paracoccaceae bacterium]